jgi:acetyl esterase/lipase
MVFDRADIARRIRALGTEITPAAIEGTAALYAPFHEREPYQAATVTRDVRYGAHERNRLDIFAPAAAGQSARPVLLFIHGGGFVGGDKRMPGSPYNDNVALWALRHGFIGVNMTYRLAPQSPWPAGAEDVAQALAWVRGGIAAHGGDPSRVFLLGTSAGAVHASTYIAHRQFHPSSGAGVAGGILLSGMYDLPTAPRSPMQVAYFGNDDASYRSASPLEGLIETKVPLMFVLTESDPEDFQRQTLKVLDSWFARHRRWPFFVHMTGHNHLSSSMHLNTADTYLGERILDFTGAGAS